MSDPKQYTRKISADEELHKYIFILKNGLTFFPPIGTPFTLIHGKLKNRVCVESYHCTCRGPQLPHEHYLIGWEGVRRGDKITITRDSKVGDHYVLASARQ
jgi:hypothetical protein